ncbi:MAG: molybdopterin-dependent oxidoreductase [Longimicrobiales bacterium]|nr:molybdopterin-dependent oxidoreductase [Longimicrobiales bacterium]
MVRTVTSVIPPDDGGEGIGVFTTCPFCSCGCGLTLLHDSVHTTGSSPGRQHPVSQGRICARGWAAHEPSAWGPRLLAPSLRDPGGPRSASWDEALERAATGLRSLLKSGKRVGVIVSGGCSNEEAYLAVKLARGALGTGNVDASLGRLYDALLRGMGSGAGRFDPGRGMEQVEACRRILVLEGDLAATHPRLAFSVLRAVRRGATLVTLGLARTRMSEVAAAHFPLDPLDPELLPDGLVAALAPEAGDNGSTAVLLAPFTSDLEALAATVRALVHWLGGRGKASGSGARFLPLPLRANTRGAHEAGAVPDRLPGGRPLTDERARARIRSAWGVDPCLDAGLDAEGMLGGVHGLVVVRDDPTSSARFPGEAARALRSLESLVVLDAYRSPTSDAATVVLPVAALQETRGTVTSVEGRVQRVRAAVPPPGEARPGWQALARLVESLGLGEAPVALADVTAEMGRVIPELAALTPEALESLGGAALPPVEGADEGTDLHWEAQSRLKGNGSPGNHVLALEGAFEWEDDLLVEASPTLRRDGAARRKLFPRGLVTMNPSDGRALGVRAGWTVRLRSRKGEASVPVTLDPRVEPGLLLVPYGHREALAPVLGDEAAQRVEVERT